MASFYPLTTKEELIKEFVGKSLKDVPTPAAVLDLGKVKNNCNRMLAAVDELGFGWRAHVKSHKTTELTRLQVGEGSKPVNIIVSTVIEAESVAPLLLEYKAAGREINVLYALPPTPSSIPRLVALSKSLGPSALSLMIDHPSQLTLLTKTSFPHPPLIFLKIDMGTHRAGVVPSSPACTQLLTTLLELHSQKLIIFHGLYAHAGHSYSSDSPTFVLECLLQEFESLRGTSATLPKHPLILSVGATPTAISTYNLLPSTHTSEVPNAEDSTLLAALQTTLQQIKQAGDKLELHAGVYPLLDIQQLSTHALPTPQLQWDDLAFTLLAEVASLYPARGANSSTEVLIGAGTLALGREPCKAYKGWGVLAPWNRAGASLPAKGPEEIDGWVVGRISQEHGILTWSGRKEEEALEAGQMVRIWPNHACISGVGYNWYLIVDGSDEIVDVWVRWRGW